MILLISIQSMAHRAQIYYKDFLEKSTVANIQQNLPNINLDFIISANHFPVEPKPPAPRTESLSSETSS